MCSNKYSIPRCIKRWTEAQRSCQSRKKMTKCATDRSARSDATKSESEFNKAKIIWSTDKTTAAGKRQQTQRQGKSRQVAHLDNNRVEHALKTNNYREIYRTEEYLLWDEDKNLRRKMALLGKQQGKPYENAKWERQQKKTKTTEQRCFRAKRLRGG